MNPAWQLHTGRLLMRPVGWTDLADLIALKSDPRSFAAMLGGVRQPEQVVAELASDISDWSRLGFGIWAIQDAEFSKFIGIVGLQERPDGRGIGLRFALNPSHHGRGFATEAATSSLRFGHERACLSRIVAIAREDNIQSRQVLGTIGMIEEQQFQRSGVPLLLYVSILKVL